jgi:hypothetical protein
MKITWKDKLHPPNLQIIADAGSKADEILIRYLPKIRQFFVEKAGPAVANVASDDKNLAVLGRSAYGLLPFPVRLIVREEAFIRFCLAHRDKLLTGSSGDSRLLSAPSEGTKSTAPPLPPAAIAEAQTDRAV